MSAFYYGSSGFATGETKEVEVTITWNPEEDEPSKIVDFIGERFANGETKTFDINEIRALEEGEEANANVVAANAGPVDTYGLNNTVENSAFLHNEGDRSPIDDLNENQVSSVQSQRNQTIKMRAVPRNDIYVMGKTFKSELASSSDEEVKGEDDKGEDNE